MRGLAALGVVAFHIDTPSFSTFPHAGLAVDVFFAMSGFVLYRAYADRITNGYTVRNFLEARFVRLYPLYFLGVILGSFREFGRILINSDAAMSSVDFIITFPLHLLALPSPVHRELFALNIPAWSLFFEVCANILLVIWLVRAGKRQMGAVLIVSAAIITAAALKHGTTSLGWVWLELAPGAARTAFGFGVGIVCAKWVEVRNRPTNLFIVPLALLAVAMIIQTSPETKPVYEILLTIIGVPVLLWLGVQAETPERWRPAANLLGDLSYPLYMIHFPLFSVARNVWIKTGFGPAPFYFLFIGGMIPIALVLVHFYDNPTRKWIAQRLHTRKAPLPKTQGIEITET